MARAIGYRARHNIAPQDVSLGVVVQVMVPADAAGILFTANPLTGARSQMMINAAWRLGEAIVGGHVTPDKIVVDKSGVIVEQQISETAVMTVRRPRARARSRFGTTGVRSRCSTRSKPPNWRDWACRSRRSTAGRWISNGPCATAKSLSCRRAPASHVVSWT